MINLDVIKKFRPYKAATIDNTNNEILDTCQGFLTRLSQFNLDLLKNVKAILVQDKHKDNIHAIILNEEINKFISEFSKANKYYTQLYNIMGKGRRGEDKVADCLFTFNSEWKVLKDITLEVEGNKIQNDFIIIDNSGVYTIEVKNIGNKNDTLLIDKLGRGSIRSPREKNVAEFDVLQQSNRHLGYLKKFLAKNHDYYGICKSIIVIASDIRVINKSDEIIIGPNLIYKTIKSHFGELDDSVVDEIYTSIKNSSSLDTKYTYINYIDTMEFNYKLILYIVSNLL